MSLLGVGPAPMSLLGVGPAPMPLLGVGPAPMSLLRVGPAPMPLLRASLSSVMCQADLIEVCDLRYCTVDAPRPTLTLLQQITPCFDHYHGWLSHCAPATEMRCNKVRQFSCTTAREPSVCIPYCYNCVQVLFHNSWCILTMCAQMLCIYICMHVLLLSVCLTVSCVASCLTGQKYIDGSKDEIIN